MDKIYQRVTSVRQTDQKDEAYPNRHYFRAEISNGNLDSYKTIMAPSSLENYANDASAGVNILDSHNWKTIGVGRTTNGVYDRENNKVEVDFYVLDDLDLTNQSFANTASLIKAINDGLANDVSIGFVDGKEMCSVCGKNLWGADSCDHWPGDKVVIETNGTDEVKECYGHIEDARLAEVSIVYDGATPGAQIISKNKDLIETKAKRIFNNLSIEERQQISTRFNIDLSDSDKRTKDKQPEQKITDKKEYLNMSTLPKDERIQELEAANEALTKRCNTAEEQAKGVFLLRAEKDELTKRLQETQEEAKSYQKVYETQKERVDSLEAYKKRTEPIVKSFEEFKEEEISKAMEVRLGAFPEEDKDSEDYNNDQTVLRSLGTIKQIRKYADAWTKLRDSNFPGGNQLGKDESDDDDDDEPTGSHIVPDTGAY